MTTARPTVVKNPNFNEHEETIHFPLVGTYDSAKWPIMKYSIGGPLRKLHFKLISIGILQKSYPMFIIQRFFAQKTWS